MPKKRTKGNKSQYQYLPTEYEYAMLTLVQSGDRWALFFLTLQYQWFIKMLTEERLRNKRRSRALYLHTWERMVTKFERCARELPLHDPNTCFLEEVWKRVKQEQLDERITEQRELKETVFATESISFQTPVGVEKDSELGDFIPDRSPKVTDLVHRMQLEEKVPKLLDELDSKERRLIELHFHEGLDLRDVAKELDLSLFNTKNMLRKTLARLKHSFPKDM